MAYVPYGKIISAYPAIERTLRLSKVNVGEKVIIFTDTAKNKNLVDAFFTAALNLGADAMMIVCKPGIREPPRFAIEAMKNADTVIDMSSSVWAYSPAFSEVLDSARILMCYHEDESDCVNFAPRDDITKKSKKGAELLERARTLRITSKAGTDLRMSKEGRPAVGQVGFLAEERSSKWDVAFTALAMTAPIENSANGTLILSPGDIPLPINISPRGPLPETIKCTLEDGRVTKIEGASEAMFLQEWFEHYNDPKAYNTSHIGFGCDPRVNVFSMHNLEYLDGSVVLAFGNNTLKPLGGANDPMNHIDIVLRKTNFYADDELLIKEGRFVHKDLV
jgi:2,5-dihydroxypyridine 5,6-dioxygenase